MKISSKFFIVFFSLFALVTVLNTYISYTNANTIIINNYSTKAQENLDYMLEITDQQIYQLNQSFNYLVTSQILQDRISTDYLDYSDQEKIKSDEALDNALLSLINFDFFDSTQNVYIYNPAGVEYWNNIASRNIPYKIYRDMIIEAKPSDSYNASYLGMDTNSYDSTPDIVRLRFARSIFKDTGEFIGYIYMDFDTNYFYKLLNTKDPSIHTDLYMIDGDDNIIYSENTKSIGSRLYIDRLEGIIEEKTLSNYGWRIISATPTNVILKDSQNILKQTLINSVISITIVALLIMLLTYKLLGPIRSLVSEMEKVRTGNLDVYVEKKTNDEFGKLTDVFNSMISELNTNMEQKLDYLKQVNDSEYKILQTQINPHFMYNTLNSVKWMAQIQNANNITELVDLLWQLLKLTSHNSGQYIPLSEELKIVDVYSQIQLTRYNGKFKMRYDIDEASTHYIVPKFLLQPLVENSIFHGIEPKKGRGIITITSTVIDNDLHVVVSDDGVGMTPVQAHQLLINSNHYGRGFNSIGINNVNQRLVLLFGKDYALKIESEVNVGTTIRFRVPTDFQPDNKYSIKG